MSGAGGGFFLHALWLVTSQSSWVENGYVKEPNPYGRFSYYYTASATATSYVEEIRDDLSPASIGSYSKFQIYWDGNTRKWRCTVNGREIGYWSNIGVNDGTEIQAGIETNGGRNSSPRAPLYGISYATLANWTWRPWPDHNTVEILPARFYWVNRPRSGETSMP